MLVMEIVYKGDGFKIKGKTGVLYSKKGGVLIEPLDGNSSKELTGPGEYEVSGISVIGIQTEIATIFVYEVDGFRICDLDNLQEKIDDSKISQIGDIDILLLPIFDKSIEVMQQIESYYVIPTNYKDKENLDKFLKDSTLVVEKMNKFSLKKEDLIEDATAQIILLES